MENITAHQQATINRIVEQYRRVKAVMDRTTDPRKARNARNVLDNLIRDAQINGVLKQVRSYLAH